MSTPTNARLLRFPEVMKKVGASNRSTIYQWITRGQFPKPLKITARFAAWPESVIDAWIAERASESQAGSA